MIYLLNIAVIYERTAEIAAYMKMVVDMSKRSANTRLIGYYKRAEDAATRAEEAATDAEKAQVNAENGQKLSELIALNAEDAKAQAKVPVLRAVIIMLSQEKTLRKEQTSLKMRKLYYSKRKFSCKTS